MLLALRASGNASEGARSSPAEAAGRRALTAEQERRFGIFRKRSRHQLVGLGHLGLSGGHAGAELVAAAAGRTGQGGGAARAGPLPLPFPSVGPGGRPLVGPGGVGSVPTDGERECWPSLVLGE